MAHPSSRLSPPLLALGSSHCSSPLANTRFQSPGVSSGAPCGGEGRGAFSQGGLGTGNGRDGQHSLCWLLSSSSTALPFPKPRGAGDGGWLHLDVPLPDPLRFLPRLSSLSSLGDSSSERRSPGHRRQPSDSSETTGLVQRCVIIQKDQHGFGFTVSGDRVVLVQSVRPGGAAMRAGVQEGDRIVKVNGTMVTNSSHLEVVKLIKSGAYVALTLLGSPPPSVGLPSSQQDVSMAGAPRVTPACPPPPPPPPLPPPQRITDPKPLQDPEVQKHATQILRNMLRQEEAELQVQLLLPPHGSSWHYPGRLSLDSQDGDSGLESGTERFPSVSEVSLNRNSVLSDHGLDSPRTSPVITARLFQHHRRQGSDTPGTPCRGLDRTGRPLIIGPEEDCDPGYFNNECDSLFQDLGKLKSRPAHLGVFLRYIFSQADPSPLLFYLCTDVCQQTTAKDSRSLGKDIWNIFLDRNAPLRVKVAEQLLAEIEARLRNGDDVRAALFEAQEMVMPEIQEQIQDYRTKRTMGLGSLYGENDLLDLDGDPQKERQVAEKQLAQLGDILSKYEEDRSSPMAFALSTYMNHAGIRGREPRAAGASEKAPSLPDRDKWLPFFPKAKKSSSTKKDKDAMEDKKRNPILKYIGKPKISSQSTFHVPLSPVEVKPGNVRNIIQHFENNQHCESQEPGSQRLSTGSFPEDLLESDSSRAEVKLGRSESLKGREEMKKSRKVENVPRSRSDVDMDAAAEATRLHQSASSSASSLSTRWEVPSKPQTPTTASHPPRSIESPNLGFGVDPFLPHLLEDEQGQLSDLEPELDSQNWQHTVSRDLVANLPQKEIDRQEVINELFATEGSHLRILRVLDLLFYQRMKKESLLSREELALLFPNLPDLIEIHNSLSESMKKLREEGPIIKEIGDLMLSRFDGLAKEEIQQVAADFCSYQSIALELIKTKQRKETRFQIFMQEAESNPQCRRLQLKDLIISEMQRLTKYPLLLENIIKHTEAGTSEHEKLCRARDQCRDILRHVNEAVKRAENRHRLEGYQKRLDATSLERTSNPLAAEFKSLDLTSRCMIHEGPLSWRVSKDKTVDLHVLLLEDLLVLLQKQDEKLVLKCHSKTALGSSDNKQTFSPVLKLNSVLIRSVATDKRALFIICTSELGPQIYELVALTSSEKNTWMELLEEAVQSATRNATFPPKRRTPEPTRAAASGIAPQVRAPPSPACPGGPGRGSHLSLLPTADDNPPALLGREKPPEEPLSSEVEDGEEELAAAPLPTGAAGEVPDPHPAARTGPPMCLLLPGPVSAEGLAEAALEDEPPHHLPGVSPLSVCPLVHVSPLSPQPQEASSSEGTRAPGGGHLGGDTLPTLSLRTVPTARTWSELGMGPCADPTTKGHNPHVPCMGGTQRPPPHGTTSIPPAGPCPLTLRIPSAGNYFYVSMPVGLPPAPPLSPPREPPARPSPPEAPPGDVDLIFRTIEQLTLKLNRLKVSPKPGMGSLGGRGHIMGVIPPPSHHTPPLVPCRAPPPPLSPPFPHSLLPSLPCSPPHPLTPLPCLPGSRAPLAEAPPPDPDL
uniref:Rho guanine nucleotide exchange factor 11 n=1 Tax=Strigops habroptila TaxID=2489341 RepID=A0A672TYX6_STRHB